MTDGTTLGNLNTPPTDPYNTRKKRMQGYAAYYGDRAIQPVVWLLSKFTNLTGASIMCYPTHSPRSGAWREVDSRGCSYFLHLGHLELVADVIHSEAAAHGECKTLDGWW